MLRARLACLVMLLCICGGAVADSTSDEGPVVLVRDGTRIRVSVVHNRPAHSWALRVRLKRDGQAATWDYEYLTLDPEEENPAAALEIRALRGVPFLFVHVYSGGASCCWSLLVFDLAQLKPLGEQLSSSASIHLRRNEATCGLEAEYYLVRSPTRRRVRCFDGTAFRKVPR